MLLEYYSVLSEVQEDLMEGKPNDDYETFLNKLDDKNRDSRLKIKGGKTRKNRKSRK